MFGWREAIGDSFISHRFESVNNKEDFLNEGPSLAQSEAQERLALSVAVRGAGGSAYS